MKPWYVLQDGTYADPAEVGRDAAGVLRHSGGIAVSTGPCGPRYRHMSPHEALRYRAREKANCRNRNLSAGSLEVLGGSPAVSTAPLARKRRPPKQNGD